LVRSVGSTPRHSAATLVVFPDGSAVGSIGGGAMEWQAVADAQAALAEGRPRLVEYNLIGRVEGNLGLCGGTQEAFIDLWRLDAAHTVASLLGTVQTALGEGEPSILATVIRADEESGVSIGRSCVIRRSGAVQGSLGQPGLDRAVVDAASSAFAEGYPSRLAYDPPTGTVKRLMSTRRAPIEIFLQVIDPRPRLLIIGAGHIGAALARLGKFLGWWVGVVDDRPGFLTSDRLPGVDLVYQADYQPDSEVLAPMEVVVTPGTAVVVTTWGWDEPALRWLAGSAPTYIGLVSSLRKAALIFQQLRDEGVDPAWLDQVRVPVGLDLGAESPEEIALAIMAEALAVSRRKSGRPLREVRGERVKHALGTTVPQMVTVP
ncbi:MAG: XdhC family protein, partial [Anaerolineae bacterium]|nr:XdhC family protein [Anaerolineae bacterium]